MEERLERHSDSSTSKLIKFELLSHWFSSKPSPFRDSQKFGIDKLNKHHFTSPPPLLLCLNVYQADS